MTHDNTESKALFGFWLYILSDVILFAVLFATYAVLRTGTAGGIGASALAPLPRALGETLLLLLSSFICGLGRGRTKAWTLGLLAITFLLGLLFFNGVGGDLASLIRHGNTWEKSAFLSAYFLLVGALLMHVVAGLLWMLVLFVQIWRRGMNASTHRRFLCLQMFWHFLNIVWVGIYSWVYLVGAV